MFGGLLIFLEVLRVNMPASRKSKSKEHPPPPNKPFAHLPSASKYQKVDESDCVFAFLSFENGAILELSIAQRSHAVAISEFSATQLNLE